MRALAITAALWLAGLASAQQTGPVPTASSLQDRAYVLEQHGEFGKAAELYLQLVQQVPDKPELALAAGRCLGRAGRFNDALDLLEQKRKQFPAVLDLAAMQARTWLLKYETDGGVMPEVTLTEARTLAESVLRQDPQHQDAILILAQTLYLLGDEAAVATAEEAARRHPQHPGPAILLGRIAADRCRELHRKLAADGPDEALQQQLAVQRKAAQAAYRQAAALDPARPFPHIALADLAIWDGDSAAAVAHCIDALAIDPDAAVNHAWIEQHLDWQQRRDLFGTALQRYRQTSAPSLQKAATLRFYQARALYDGKQFADALSAFEQVLADNPGYTNAAYYATFAAWWQHDEDRAERHAALYAGANARAFADVIRALPDEQRADTAAIVKYLGDRAYKAARLDRSRDINHVIACLLDSADAWNNYAFLCRETKAYEQSFAAYESAMEKEPESPQLLNDAAVILQYHLPSAEHLQQARSMYLRAVQLAEQQLDDQQLTPERRRRAEQARSDAQANLQKLDGA